MGIYFFQSRWFDPSLGRFLPPDTIVPTSTQGTQAWDRYAFVNNNPVRYNDPTGHFANILLGAALGVAAGAFVYTYNCAIHNVEMNGADLAWAAGTGLVAGALIGSGVGATAGIGVIASAAGIGMATSAIGYTIAAGADYKSEEMLVSATIGGLAGAATAGMNQSLTAAYKRSNQSGLPYAKMVGEAFINGSASFVQAALTGGQENSFGIGLIGGGSTFAGELALIVMGTPKWAYTPFASFAKSLITESLVNETTDCDDNLDYCSE